MVKHHSEPQDETTQTQTQTQPIQGRSLDSPGIDPLAATIETKDTNLGGLAKADRFAKGMGFKVLALRVQPADYTATGLTLTNTLAQIGWKNVYGAVGLSWATTPTGSPQTWTIKPFLIVWDALNKTLRAYKGAAGALTEIAGADIAANDMVRVILVGG
jgi:hypothetical protein